MSGNAKGSEGAARGYLYACGGEEWNHNRAEAYRMLCRVPSRLHDGFGYSCCLPQKHDGLHSHHAGVAWATTDDVVQDEPAAGPSEALPVAPSVSVEERASRAMGLPRGPEYPNREIHARLAAEIRSAESAAYARGLERAALRAARLGSLLTNRLDAGTVAALNRLAEDLRALAGTEAQPPPDARVRELLEALRAATDELCAEHCEWALRGDHTRECLARRSLLGASDPAEGK